MMHRESTRDMSREEWLQARTKGIGGSDAAAVLGLNAYKSAYSLWSEKTGKYVPEDISDKESVRLGNDLEQYVADRFEEATGKKVRRCNYIIRNDDYPFAHANPDRMVVGENAGLECKTTSSWEIISQLRNGIIPEMWYCQIVHYMMVTGADRWYLGVLAFGSGFYHFTVERSKDEIAALADAESAFWAMVRNDTPPGVDGAESTTEALKVIYGESAAGTSADLTAVGDHIEAFQALSKQADELDEMMEEHRNAIKAFMGETEKGTYGKYTVSWKTSNRKSFNRSEYEKANGPIPEQYYTASSIRPFVIREKK